MSLSVHARGRASGLGNTLPLAAGNQYKTYKLNKLKALQKKLHSCQLSPIEVIEKNCGNFVITCNTAAFEQVRGAFFNLLHLNNQTGMGSRHIKTTTQSDCDGIVDTEVICITNWAAVAKPSTTTAQILNGECVISLSIYRGKSKCLINGKDAGIFVDLAVPALTQLLENMKSDLEEQNDKFEAILTEALDGNAEAVDTTSKQPTINSTSNCAPNKLPEEISTLAVKNTSDEPAEKHQAAPDQDTDHESSEEEAPLCAAGCGEKADKEAAICEVCQYWKHYACENLCEPEIKHLEEGSSYTCKSCRILEETTKSPPATNKKTGKPSRNKKAPPPTNPGLPDSTPHRPPLQPPTTGALAPLHTGSSTARPNTHGPSSQNFRCLLPSIPLDQNQRDPRVHWGNSGNPDWRHRPQCDEIDPWVLIEEKDRQLRNKDRMLKAKDTSIRKIEDSNQSLQEQMQAAQVLINKLEAKINTLTDENRLLKIKVCASDDLQRHPQPQNNPTTTHCTQHQQHAYCQPPPPTFHPPPAPYGYPYPPMFAMPPFYPPCPPPLHQQLPNQPNQLVEVLASAVLNLTQNQNHQANNRQHRQGARRQPSRHNQVPPTATQSWPVHKRHETPKVNDPVAHTTTKVSSGQQPPPDTREPASIHTPRYVETPSTGASTPFTSHKQAAKDDHLGVVSPNPPAVPNQPAPIPPQAQQTAVMTRYDDAPNTGSSTPLTPHKQAAKGDHRGILSPNPSAVLNQPAPPSPQGPEVQISHIPKVQTSPESAQNTEHQPVQEKPQPSFLVQPSLSQLPP